MTTLPYALAGIAVGVTVTLAELGYPIPALLIGLVAMTAAVYVAEVRRP